jgi:hypothetical protein
MATDIANGTAGTSPNLRPETPDQGYAPQDGAPFIERFQFGAAGAPISDLGQSVRVYQARQDNLGPENIWYPFRSQRDWDFARWAKNRGPSSTAVTELLAMDGVRPYQSELSFIADIHKGC